MDTRSPKPWSLHKQREKQQRTGLSVVCMTVQMCIFSGKGVNAWKQVSIVQCGVMREVIRVRVSWAAPYLCLKRASEPRWETIGIVMTQVMRTVKGRYTQTTTQGVKSYCGCKKQILHGCGLFIFVYIINLPFAVNVTTVTLHTRFYFSLFVSVLLVLFTTWGRQTAPMHQHFIQSPEKMNQQSIEKGWKAGWNLCHRAYWLGIVVKNIYVSKSWAMIPFEQTNRKW